MSSDSTESSGVQQLIDRLHQEGVAKGQEEADGLMAEARRQAMEHLDQARKQAEEILAAAREEAERTRIGGEEAVRLAGRDAILHMSEELREDFVAKLRKLVGQTLRDTKFLQKLILEIVRSGVPDSDGPMNILLLQDDSTGGKTQPRDDQALDEFVRSLGGEALRDGLTFEIVEHDVPGIRVQIVDDDLEIDLSSETLTHVLIRHLSPRFRAIVEQS